MIDAHPNTHGQSGLTGSMAAASCCHQQGLAQLGQSDACPEPGDSDTHPLLSMPASPSPSLDQRPPPTPSLLPSFPTPSPPPPAPDDPAGTLQRSHPADSLGSLTSSRLPLTALGSHPHPHPYPHPHPHPHCHSPQERTSDSLIPASSVLPEGESPRAPSTPVSPTSSARISNPSRPPQSPTTPPRSETSDPTVYHLTLNHPQQQQHHHHHHHHHQPQLVDFNSISHHSSSTITFHQELRARRRRPTLEVGRSNRNHGQFHNHHQPNHPIDPNHQPIPTTIISPSHHYLPYRHSHLTSSSISIRQHTQVANLVDLQTHQHLSRSQHHPQSDGQHPVIIPNDGCLDPHSQLSSSSYPSYRHHHHHHHHHHYQPEPQQQQLDHHLPCQPQFASSSALKLSSSDRQVDRVTASNTQPNPAPAETKPFKVNQARPTTFTIPTSTNRPPISTPKITRACLQSSNSCLASLAHLHLNSFPSSPQSFSPDPNQLNSSLSSSSSSLSPRPPSHLSSQSSHHLYPLSFTSPSSSPLNSPQPPLSPPSTIVPSHISEPPLSASIPLSSPSNPVKPSPPASFSFYSLFSSLRRRSSTIVASSSNPSSYHRALSPSMACLDYPNHQFLCPPSSSNHLVDPSCKDSSLEKTTLPTSAASSYPFLSNISSHLYNRIPPLVNPSPKRRSWVDYFLVLLVLVILGTVVVLSTVNFYMGIYPSDVILPSELEGEISNLSRVPKIIHQTWKTDEIPERWVPVRESCVAVHPGWKYMLWTDKTGRELIEREYPWFLSVYDGYRYPIQRADAVRYFILHHYGGVYMDLDIGCIRPMDSLLRFDLVLPQTVPVGVSNDLMFSAKGHPFMDFIIHRLAQFDHDYQLNYATVMFSTGPMALSALLSWFRRSPSLGITAGMPAFGPVRILPPKLYGKNLAAPQGSPGPYFTHYYGSSWHTDGAGAVLWLGRFGIFWLYGGIAVVMFFAVRAGLRRWLRTSPSGEAQIRGSLSVNCGSFPLKGRGSTGALWKRRLMRARRAEGRLADVLLLPGHWLDQVTAHAPSKYATRTLRAHRKDCMQCSSCLMNQGFIDSGAQLPPYESRPSKCLASRRSLNKGPLGKSHRNDGGLEEEDWEEVDEDTALLSSTSSSEFISNPTPILLPSTPTLYRSSNLQTTGVTSLRIGNNNEEVGAALPSPLLNAIYRLAEMAGIVSENGPRSEFNATFPTRLEESGFPSPRTNVTRKVD